jgi:uncharacterized membrane protein YkvA (DUF1232 family)
VYSIAVMGSGISTLVIQTHANQAKNRMNKLIILLIVIGALLYVVFPRDLIPDYLLGWGWIDDLAVLYMLWRYYRRLTQPQRTGNRSEQPRGRADDQQSHAADTESRDHQNPYMVLGIAPGASREEIKSAYRRLAAKYHPDKVQHLGQEFQKLAEERFRNIQQAYDELISR